jgi:hypothetical protein
VFAVVPSFWACGTGEKKLSHEDIRIEIANLRTFAASAQLLCESFEQHKTTLTFLKTQASLLADKASASESALDGNGGDAEEARRRGQISAGYLRSLCEALEKDPNGVTAAIDEAKAIATNAAEIEHALR